MPLSMQEEEYDQAVHYYKLALELQPNDGYLYASWVMPITNWGRGRGYCPVYQATEISQRC